MKTVLATLVLSMLSMAATTPESCQVIEGGRATGRIIHKTEGDGFYNQASQLARTSGHCVKASLFADWGNNSVRVYEGRTGKRVSSKGDSEYSANSQYAGAVCIDMVCNALRDSKGQTAQGQYGEVIRPGARVETPSSPAPTYGGSTGASD